MSLIIFILLLVALIIVHEFGHFAIAKLFGIRVDEFAIFFPPRIAAWKRGETEYSINWIPLGGLVRIYGESNNENVGDPRSFAHKNRLVQAAVVVAGVVMNLIAGWLLLSAGYIGGLPTSLEHKGIGVVADARPMIVAVLPGSPAEMAGLVAGDTVTSLESATDSLKNPAHSDAVRGFIAAQGEKSIIINVLRDGGEKTLLAKPALGVVEGRAAIGVELDDVGVLKLAAPQALVQGAMLAEQITVTSAQKLGEFFTHLVGGTADLSQVSGPIGITALGLAALKQGFASALVLVAVISLNLALFNLVPIPGLDGGKLLIIGIEALIRRSVPERLTLGLTLAGFALLLLLILIVSVHDISRLIHPA